MREYLTLMAAVLKLVYRLIPGAMELVILIYILIDFEKIDIARAIMLSGLLIYCQLEGRSD